MTRGELYWFDFGEARGSEADGERLGVVVSTDELNARLDTVVVLPTSAGNLIVKRKHWHNVLLEKRQISGLPEDCVAQAHLVRHVSRERLLNPNPVAQTPDEVMHVISIAMGKSLDSFNPLED